MRASEIIEGARAAGIAVEDRGDGEWHIGGVGRPHRLTAEDDMLHLSTHTGWGKRIESPEQIALYVNDPEAFWRG